LSNAEVGTYLYSEGCWEMTVLRKILLCKLRVSSVHTLLNMLIDTVCKEYFKSAGDINN